MMQQGLSGSLGCCEEMIHHPSVPPVQGGVNWVGGGLMILVGSPVFDFAGLFASELVGEYNGMNCE